MPYAPPRIKPPLPPLRPPAPFPFRPPGPNRLPPTQTAPIFSPPTLLPPTDRDLKGTVCIYANTPIWELKKIRYKYPGESWQEIAGDRFTLENLSPEWNPLPDVWYAVHFQGIHFISGDIVSEIATFQGGFVLVPTLYWGEWVWSGPFDSYVVRGTSYAVLHRNGTVDAGGFIGGGRGMTEWPTGLNYNKPPSRYNDIRLGSFSITKVVRISDGQEIPPITKCVFKVFDVFDQEILSITRDVCPEVMIVPERCYYKAENERLVRKVNVGFFQNLRTEYNGNCATVWLDAPPLEFATEMYKECSDNPNCPPPRIRFDKKCEEKCEQCPPGTTIKVLLGNRIACVDAFGCVLKTVKFKPGCNNYDCICG